MKKKLILITLCALFCFNSFSQSGFEWAIDREVFKEMPSVRHFERSPFGSYLVQNINYRPIKKLFNLLDRFLGGSLSKINARTEAHMTIITPPEYVVLNRRGLQIEDIHQLAEEENFQEFDFKVICIGRLISKDDNEDKTYYIVVESPEALKFRHKIATVFYQLGGSKEEFDPDYFFPHITIGYTVRDLYNGKKNVSSCWGKVF